MIYKKMVTIFGANGFVGAEIVHRLARQGYMIKLPHRYPKACDGLKINGQIGQIVPVPCDFSQKSIEETVQGSSFVINCLGILAEGGKRTFMKTHCELPEMMAKACKKHNVEQFIHVGALGVDKSKSKYAKSKLAGEKAVVKAFDQVTILRPSIVFGPRDNFFNRFAGMARVLPFLPLIGGGKTLFQPVYVGDVAQCVVNSIKTKSCGTYELGGPEIMSFRDLLYEMKIHTGQMTPLIRIPFVLAYIQAFFMQFLPGKPLTPDQVKSLKTDNIVQDYVMQMSDLGVKQTRMDTILPTYLDRF